MCGTCARVCGGCASNGVYGIGFRNFPKEAETGLWGKKVPYKF